MLVTRVAISFWAGYHHVEANAEKRKYIAQEYIIEADTYLPSAFAHDRWMLWRHTRVWLARGMP